MEYNSILFRTEKMQEAADYQNVLKDINVDQIISSVTGSYEEYKLEEYFLTPLENLEDVEYRQDIMRDLEMPELIRGFVDFSEIMRQSKKALSLISSVCYEKQNERNFLEGVRLYCDSIELLNRLFLDNEVQSSGLSDIIRKVLLSILLLLDWLTIIK